MDQPFILQGGTVVTPERVENVDILIEGQTVVAVGHSLAADTPDARIVGAGGLTILPGLIDVHVHLREPGGEHKEDFRSGTRAALAGGVTTVLAMPNTNPPITNRETLDLALSRAAASAVCDYGHYVGGTPDNSEEAASLEDAAALKLYIGSSTGSLLVDQFPAQIAHMERYPKDRIIAVHAEDEAAVQYYAKLGLRRPPICAALATAHVLALAEQVKRRLHVCHVSTGNELAQIRAARERGLDVTCEVAPHHLFLSTQDEEGLGALGRVNPPLRAIEEVESLWAQADFIDLIATDHAPHTIDEKRSANPPSGMPGLETMLPLLLTAFHEGRVSLTAVARWTSARPAEVFRLANKGRIEPGFDADLTLVNLNEEWTIQNEGVVSRCGWTPFDGKGVRGRVSQVYLRGSLVFDKGLFLAAAGSGRRVLQSH